MDRLIRNVSFFRSKQDLKIRVSVTETVRYLLEEDERSRSSLRCLFYFFASCLQRRPVALVRVDAEDAAVAVGGTVDASLVECCVTRSPAGNLRSDQKQCSV
jgi:hypothetical protein